jgi:peroxiredoxin
MWLVARRGHLKVGDPAPDFSLKTADSAQIVRLSSFQGQKPVVLIFGSHT